jgi:hypothetical protein
MRPQCRHTELLVTEENVLDHPQSFQLHYVWTKLLVTGIKGLYHATTSNRPVALVVVIVARVEWARTAESRTPLRSNPTSTMGVAIEVGAASAKVVSRGPIHPTAVGSISAE